MRPVTLFLAVSLSFAAGCQEDEVAVLDYTVRDATPAVPLRALQLFELNSEDESNGSIALVWGDRVEMPDRGSITYHGDPPLPFRLCAVGLGDSDDQLLHAVSDLIEIMREEEVEVVLTLAPVEPGGEVPEPCGPAVEPWPDGV